MSATVLGVGPINKAGSGTDEGHREYLYTYRIKTTSVYDGPQVVLNATGLPSIGTYLNIGNDVDAWAFRTPYFAIRALTPGEGGYYWEVDHKYSTYPNNRCNSASFEDPMDEPDRVSGSFVNDRKEAWFDKDGRALLNSAKQVIRGDVVERDFHKATVKIEKNILSLPLSDYTELMNKVNDSTMWGLPPRCIKLSGVSFDKRYYGTCNSYYVVSYDFSIDFNTFDRTALDFGTTARVPGGDPGNPQHSAQVKDLTDSHPGGVILKSDGTMWDGTGSVSVINIALYEEADLFVLGLPTSL